MSAKQVIPLVGLLCVLIAPIIGANRSTSISNNIVHTTVVNKDFTVKVNDINKSDNGFVTCKFYVEVIGKEMVGPCSTTEGLRLDVGRTYTVNNAVIDKDFISINKAKLIAGMIRRQVISVYHVGWTRVAKLDNGEVIGGDNVAIGDWISIE